MNITKFGHSCLLVEEGDVKILVDPGTFSTGFEDIDDLRAILVTHKHYDHCDIDAIEQLVKQNPKVVVYSNDDVRQVLIEKDVECVVPAQQEVIDVMGVPVKVFHVHHENIYETNTPPQNTGYVIGEKLYVTGDNVTSVPEDTVDILALPVVAPWGKLSEYLDFARSVKPRVVIPVHDAIGIPGFFAKHPANILPKFGMQVVVMENGESQNF